MEKIVLRRPFFVVNPKSYLYGEELHKLAAKTDELCERYDFQSLFTAQLIDLAAVVRVKTNEDLADVVTKRMLAVTGITKSETLIAFQVYSKHDLDSMFAIGFEK